MSEPLAVFGSNEPGVIIPASLRGAPPLPRRWRRGQLELATQLWSFHTRLPGIRAISLWPAQLHLESRRGTVVTETLALDRSCVVLQLLHREIPFELAVLPAHLPALWAVWPQSTPGLDIDQAAG